MSTTHESPPLRSIAPFDLFAAVVIGAAVMLVGLPGIRAGGLGWSDAPNHVFDGIFVLEFLRAWPLGHARQWAEQFYLRYPSLGIVAYYPPGFAVVEAAIFALFGVGVTSARACVLLHVIAACWFVYLLVRRWADAKAGLLCALLLLATPQGYIGARDVMLEWPAAAWLLACIYCYQKDRDTLCARWAVGWPLCGLVAFMVKQTAGFILPVLLLHALIGHDRRRFLARAPWIVSQTVAFAAIAAYSLGTRQFATLPNQLLGLGGSPHYYISHAHEVFGWVLLPLVLIGLVRLIRGIRSRVGLLLFLWFGTWAAFSSLIRAQEPRYFFFAALPLFAALVGAGNENVSLPPSGPRRPGGLKVAIAVLLLALQLGQDRRTDAGRLPTYEPAVRALARLPDADVLLVDAVRDGQFAFDLYQHQGAEGHLIPLRASKLLYARPSRAKWGLEVFVHTAEDIVALLDRYGIRYIVVESRALRTDETDADRPPRELLRRTLAVDPRFVLVQSWPLSCDDPIWDDVDLRLYAYPSCPERTSNRMKLSIPAIGKSVEFELPTNPAAATPGAHVRP